MNDSEKKLIEEHGKKIAVLKDICDKLDNLDKLYFSRYLLNAFITITEQKYEEYLKSLESKESSVEFSDEELSNKSIKVKVDKNGKISKVD